MRARIKNLLKRESIPEIFIIPLALGDKAPKLKQEILSPFEDSAE